jgi:S-adenosylmethionine synthetase
MIELECMSTEPAGERPFEIVERKGVGHPDFICDAIAEEAAAALEQAYIAQSGEIAHFNLDKGLLAAGRAAPSFGGGQIEEPMRFIYGDRAACSCGGKPVPVADIVETAAAAWIRRHLRFVEPGLDLVFQNEVRPGSTQLSTLFQSRDPLANDTATGVGFAPLSETEELVIEAERFLNSSEFKRRVPESGEDVKVLGVRRGRLLDLTVAMAFVDQYISTERDYFVRKMGIELELEKHLNGRLKALDRVAVALNLLDREGVGLAGMYLTVTGTSAENGDSGQVGRANRLCGVFSATRPASNEAAAGKNAYCHIGTIYNDVARRIAHEIHARVAGIREATVYLVGRIGDAIQLPHLAAAQLSLSPRARIEDLRPAIETVFHDHLSDPKEWFRKRHRGITVSST